MATAATVRPATAVRQRRPLFGGYALVAWAAAWLAGIALRSVAPLSDLTAVAWLLLAGLCAAVWLVAGVAYRQSASSTWLRLALVTGMLGCWIALGAARAASADDTLGPDSVVRFATGATISLQGTVAAEPDLRDGYRFLTVDVTSASVDGGLPHGPRPAASRRPFMAPTTGSPRPMATPSRSPASCSRPAPATSSPASPPA